MRRSSRHGPAPLAVPSQRICPSSPEQVSSRLQTGEFRRPWKKSAQGCAQAECPISREGGTGSPPEPPWGAVPRVPLPAESVCASHSLLCPLPAWKNGAKQTRGDVCGDLRPCGDWVCQPSWKGKNVGSCQAGSAWRGHMGIAEVTWFVQLGKKRLSSVPSGSAAPPEEQL